MRMPFLEFITSGDLKFIIVFLIFTTLAIVHFFKKFQLRNQPNNQSQITFHNSKINNASFWILISSVLSLLLGFMHSFYFIAKSGGMAPNLIFNGVAYALITPVLGVCLFIICKMLAEVFNSK